MTSAVKNFPPASRTFVIGWLLANVVTFGFAGGMFHNFELLPLSFARPGTFDLPAAGFGAIFGFVPSIPIGWLQWLNLRRHLPISRWWILTVSAGVGLNHFISDGFPHSGDLAIGLLAGCAVTGVLQWLVLRRQVRSFAWWILATVAGWSMGVLIGVSLLVATGLIRKPWSPALGFQQHGLVGIILAAVYSLVTGGVMVLLLQRNKAN